MQKHALVWAAWSMVAASGLACSSGGTAHPVLTGAAGSQAGTSGTAGDSSGGGSPAVTGVSGAGGTVSPQGTAGAGETGGSTGAAGVGAAGTGDASTTGPTDGGTGSAIMDAQILPEGGAMGAVAPGVGVDTPSPPKPTLGMYGNNTQRDIQFSANSLDPMATKGHQGDAQHGRFDSSKPTKWKLIVLLPGIGGGPGLGTSGWIASQGYHEFDVAYDSAIPGAPDKPDPRFSDPATVGNTRMNQFDAKGRMPSCGDDKCTPTAPPVARPDCIEERVMKGLAHLVEADPTGGWDWYLNADGTVRWSDAGFFGYSYGATHAAVISVYVRLGLVVVGSGPWNESHPEATWIRTASATPGIRAYAIYGKEDGRYPDYENETKELGWPGPWPFEIAASTHGVLTAATPWYMGSHSILVDDQGHTEFCATDYSECLYAFDHDGQ
jgi:hypothetical protein